VLKTAGTAATKTWTLTASGCTAPSSATFSLQVLEYDTWTSLTSSTFDADYTSYFSLAGSGLTRTFSYTAPANSMMKQLSEKVFKFRLTATATFSLSSNCSSGCGYGGCHCGNSCGCTSFSGAGQTPVLDTYFTVTWRNVCLAEVFVLPSLQQDIVY